MINKTERKGKENYNKSGKREQRCDKRRVEAVARQKEYNLLTVDEKIKRAKKRRGESKKELNRLNLQKKKLDNLAK